MKNKLVVMLLIMVISLSKIEIVHAGTNDSNLQRNFIPNYWSFHYRNNKVWTYGQLNIKYVNGKLGYCIEPDSAVNTELYNSTTDWSISKYTLEDKEKMQLYAYYGYGYDGNFDIKYYAATQHLIWLFSADENIRWTTEDHSDSREIDLSNEINLINDLVRKHNINPSFSNQTIHAYVGQTLLLNDTSEVLRNKKITSTSNYKVLGNKLKIPVTSRKPINITFSMKNNEFSNNETIVHYADIRSQRVATFARPRDNISTLTIIPDKTKVIINKKDKETNENIPSYDTLIKIKNVDTGEYIKDEEGNEDLDLYYQGMVDLYLEDGNYELEEVRAPKGYYVSGEKIPFTIDDNTELNDNYEKVIDFYNSKVLGQIQIKKTNKHGELLKNCEFEIYDENMNLVDKIITTDKEYDNSILLPLGKYYVKETKASKGYILNENIYEINLEYKDDKTPIVKEKLNVLNEKINCEILIVDTSNDGKKLEGVDISIYNSNDEIVYKGTTNEDGKILVSPIFYGDYYIVQDKVPNGYELNSEKIEFSVSDDSCKSSIKLTNNKVNMPKTNTSNMDILSIIIFILNLGIIKFVKKNN